MKGGFGGGGWWTGAKRTDEGGKFGFGSGGPNNTFYKRIWKCYHASGELWCFHGGWISGWRMPHDEEGDISENLSKGLLKGSSKAIVQLLFKRRDRKNIPFGGGKSRPMAVGFGKFRRKGVNGNAFPRSATGIRALLYGSA